MSETGSPHSAHDIVNQPAEVTVGMAQSEPAIRPGGAIHDPNEKATTETTETTTESATEEETADANATDDPNNPSKTAADNVIIDKDTKFTGELRSANKSSLKPGDKLPG